MCVIKLQAEGFYSLQEKLIVSKIIYVSIRFYSPFDTCLYITFAGVSGVIQVPWILLFSLEAFDKSYKKRILPRVR